MSTTTIILIGYPVIAACGIALAVIGRARGSTNPLRAVMSRPAGRWFVLLCWLWAGWHFFAR